MVVKTSSKALGTYSLTNGINFVPVELINILGDSVVLFNYYMKRHSKICMLIKVDREYQSSGRLFNYFKQRENHVKTTFSDIPILTLTDVFDTSSPYICL
jgi:hypothetical protein